MRAKLLHTHLVTTQPMGQTGTRTWAGLKPPRPVVSINIPQPNSKAHLGPISGIQLDRVRLKNRPFNGEFLTRPTCKHNI